MPRAWACSAAAIAAAFKVGSLSLWPGGRGGYGRAEDSTCPRWWLCRLCVRPGRSAAVAGGPVREVADIGGTGPAEPGDLVVLGGDAGQRDGLEAGQVSDGGVLAGDPPGEDHDLLGEPGDLGVPGVGMFSGGAHRLEAPFEIFAQGRVGTAAVERGPVDSCEVGQGLDVAPAAGWDVAGDQLVGGGADLLLVEQALPGRQSHGSSSSAGSEAVSPVAASMPAMTASARSRSPCRRARSVRRAGPRLPMKVVVDSACSAQTGRWTAWWVACGHRAESHIPASGVLALGVPASFRHRARDGSANQLPCEDLDGGAGFSGLLN